MPITERLTEEPKLGRGKRGRRLFTDPVGGRQKNVKGVNDDASEPTDLSGFVYLSPGARRCGPQGLNSDGYPAQAEE